MAINIMKMIFHIIFIIIIYFFSYSSYNKKLSTHNSSKVLKRHFKQSHKRINLITAVILSTILGFYSNFASNYPYTSDRKKLCN
jgi:flagellar biosynthesis protein FlhB